LRGILAASLDGRGVAASHPAQPRHRGHFFIWSFYAFSGAGFLPRIPLLRLGLFLICGIYILRGLDLIIAIVSRFSGAVIELKFYVFSAAALVIGDLFLLGIRMLWKTWKTPPLPSS